MNKVRCGARGPVRRLSRCGLCRGGVRPPRLDAGGGEVHRRQLHGQKARDLAPPKPGFWSQVGSCFPDAGTELENVGATVVNDLASLGNAAVHHPGDVAAVAGGLPLAGASAQVLSAVGSRAAPCAWFWTTAIS